MSMSEAVSTGALVMMGAILLVLLLQCLRLRELWQMAAWLPKGRALGADLGNGKPGTALGAAR